MYFNLIEEVDESIFRLLYVLEVELWVDDLVPDVRDPGGGNEG